jgi:hypothetical protein
MEHLHQDIALVRNFDGWFVKHRGSVLGRVGSQNEAEALGRYLTGCLRERDDRAREDRTRLPTA